MSSRVLASACDASVITASARLPLGVRTETKIFSAAPSRVTGVVQDSTVPVPDLEVEPGARLVELPPGWEDEDNPV